MIAPGEEETKINPDRSYKNWPDIAPPKNTLSPAWQSILTEKFARPEFSHLMEKINTEQKSRQDIFPEKEDIFNAFLKTPFENITTVILGQDPYHGPGQAMGLSFSVPRQVKIPPSLRNIYREIHDDIGVLHHGDGDLSPWARQGVFLLNTALTVRAGAAGSHAKFGWHEFTDHIIAAIAAKKSPVVFMLWGNHAGQKQKLIIKNSKKDDQHLILKSVHPSPLSAYRGFLGCKHFSKTNQFLKKHGHQMIEW